MQKVKTNFKPVFGIIICSMLTAVSQLFWKFGVNSDNYSFLHMLFNLNIIIGTFIYILGGVLLVLSLKHGELSFLFPMVSLSFVWVAILSLFFLEERITIVNWVGIFLIVGGISLTKNES